MDGKPRSPEQWIADADAMVAAFPFDQHLRNLRAWVRRSVNEATSMERSPQ